MPTRRDKETTMTYRSILLASVAASMATSIGAEAYAADAPAAAQAGNDITVTARRREESLQKVPTAITAFSQQMLAEKSISSSFELDHAVPGLQVSGGSGVSNQPAFAIRGRGLNFGAAAGSVETYFADVPLSGPFQMPAMSPPFFDLQSLQVLKGPQDTLFGRSTTGGAILFVPQAPSNTFGGYVRGQAGNYGDYKLEGAVNVPLIQDKASLRVAAFDWYRKGYSHTLGSANFGVLGGAGPFFGPDPFGNPVPVQDYDNQDVQGFRATLKVTPTDAISNSTIFAYDRSNNRATSSLAVANPTGLVPVLAVFPNILTLGPRIAATNVNLNRLPSADYAIINTTTFKVAPGITLKNIFGYIDAFGVSNTSADPDGSPLSVIDLPALPKRNEVAQTTDEIQLQGNILDNKLTWIAGGLIDDVRTPSGDNINTFTNSGAFDTLWEKNTTSAYGIFASATYKVTDKLSLTAGGRYNSFDVSQYSIEANPLGSGATLIANRLANTNLTPGGATAAGWHFTNPGQSLSASFHGETYNFGAEYQATDKILAYGGYRHGWKPGGFNAKPPAGLPSEASFSPETDDDFYIGVKSRFTLAGMPAQFNIEGYYDIYHGKQVSYLTAASTGLATVTINVPKTRYDGVDLDFVVDATPWLRVSANYSYIDAKFVSWPDPSYGATFGMVPNLNLNLAVNPVANVSPNKFSITPRLHTQLPGNIGELAIAPTVSYQDGWWSTDNGVLLPQGETAFLMPTNPTFNPAALGGVYVKSYTLVDLRVELNRVMGTRINAAFNLTNLTNRVYETGSTGTLAFGMEGRTYGPPRMYTFELSTKF